MKKLSLVLLVILIIGVGLAMAGWAMGGPHGLWLDRHGLHLSGGERGDLVKVDETLAGFTNVDVRADFFDHITVKEGDAYTVRGARYERYGPIDVRLDGDTLKVTAVHDRRWIDFAVDDFWNHNSYLEITYPKGVKLGSAAVELSAGKLNVNGIECETLTVDDDFGDVDISNVSAKSLRAKLNAGDLKVRNVRADKLNVTNDFGKVTLDDAVSDDIVMKLNSGDMRGSGVSAGNLIVDNDFGKVVFDSLVFTGHCDIEANSGNVDLRLNMNKDDVSYELNVSAGSINVDGSKYGGSVSSRVAGAAANLRVGNDFGSISVDFRG